MLGRLTGRLFLLLLVLGAGICGAAEKPAAELPQRHAEFLRQVAPLISAKERETFEQLRQDYQRDAFVRRFWQARDPFPQTARNEFQEKWEARTQLARDRYEDPQDDRYRMLLFNGEPVSTAKSRCSEVLLPVEVWFYADGTDLVRGSFALVFVQPLGAARGSYRLWSPFDGPSTLLVFDLRPRVQERDGLRTIASLCAGGDDIVAGIAQAVDWRQVEGSSKLIPRPSDEWLKTFVAYSTDLPEGAGTFPAQLELAYPGRYQSRTVVQALVSVAQSEVTPLQLDRFHAYTFAIDGEILRKDELFEQFRYRFSVPEKEAQAQLRDGRIPIVFQRQLRPGAYRLVLKVEDLAAHRFYREERDFVVPVVAAAPPAEAAAAEPPGAPADLAAEANASLPRSDATLRLMPPAAGLLTGKVRLEAVAAGEGIARVSFAVDGKPVLAKVRPPYSVEVDLGNQPRQHTVRALALAADGSELAEDEVVLNVGPHRFEVRLIEPRAGKTYKTSVRAQVEVAVPEGEELERVELYRNETLVATLYQPPFVQPILIPPAPPAAAPAEGTGGGLTFVRAVAYLQGGLANEDVVLVNNPEVSDRVQVDLVELYTTVLDRKGRPVEGLGRGDFKVLEDGTEQTVRRFESVKDVPIYAGVLLDTSASMAEELPDAIQGALRFFQSVVTPRDRAAVVTFNDKPNLAVRFTPDPEVLAGGLANLTAEGNTALYDSLIYTLYYFGGIRGKRAIVLLSDGKDEGSKYRFDDALEYARRAGVTIYTVGLNLSTREAEVRSKLQRFAEETGGQSFWIEKAVELERVYREVEAQLRSQYLLAYESSQSAQPGAAENRYRTIEVRLAQPGLEAKTLRGYYP